MKEGESRDYTFNLRRGFLKAPTWKRSKKAVFVLRQLIARHSKVDNVRIGNWLNVEINKHGGKNPPSKVKVNVKVEKIKNEKTKAETLIARAELAELPKKALRLIKLEEEKKAKKKTKEKLPEKLEEKPKEEKKAKKGAKKEEKRASKKELQEELVEAKEVEKKKKKAKVTAAQERAMHK